MILDPSTLEWVEFAEHDYLTAKAILQVTLGQKGAVRDYFPDSPCFQCH